MYVRCGYNSLGSICLEELGWWLGASHQNKTPRKRIFNMANADEFSKLKVSELFLVFEFLEQCMIDELVCVTLYYM